MNNVLSNYCEAKSSCRQAWSRFFFSLCTLALTLHALRSPPLPHWLDGFRTRLGDENNRAAFEPESAPQLTGQMLFVGVRKKFVPIDEEQKRPRGLPDLRGIEEFQARPPGADGLPPFPGIRQ